MNSFDLRQKFLDFFKKNGHTIVPSSSLVPAQDPTLLFTNAGMNQFKDVFIGKEKRSYKRATSIQKCVRAGGKHNDLDQVGFTNKHLTFFEMMGNFSFGDYFKKKAIEYGWQFLTKDMQIPEKKLVVSIYKDDDEAYQHWNKDIGLQPQKIFKFGKEENFWQMGETGPCGPCSEIHFDYGKNKGCKKETCNPSCNCDRFVEIWNLVFMQFNRQEDGTLVPLKQTGVDTGMGLERICMIMQKKDSIFHIDLFDVLIKKIEELTKKSYKKSNESLKSAFHILADHVRSSSLLIADGVIPSNEGRGYVLRKIIRRATIFAQKLSDNPKLFSTLANEFICYMCSIYPELKKNRDIIIKILDSEIEKFATNLVQGQEILEKYIQQNLVQKQKTLSGQQIFKLYDTYGFPPELTRVIALEKKLSLDMDGFEKEMEKQQKQSRKKVEEKETGPQIPDKISTKFVGYEKLEVETKINFVHQEDLTVWIITELSPFYVESGGQVSDTGWITIQNHTYPILSFTKSDKATDPAIAVKISLKEHPVEIKISDDAKCVIDYYNRINTAKNHTATHMLQAALTQILGDHIKQAGSLVDDKHLRFDFTHLEGLTKEQIEHTEQIVNQKIQENIKLNIFFTTLEKASAQGVKAFFGEKYNPEQVRVVQIPGFSAELCGGTHLENTGQIGCFKITSEIALSAGVRRIIAVTGPQAVKLFQQTHEIAKVLGEQFKVKPEKIISATQKQQENLQKALSEIKKLKKKLHKTQIPTWQQQVKIVGKVPFLFLELEDIQNIEAKDIFENIEKKTPGFYFMLSVKPEALSYFAYVSSKWQPQVSLKEFNNLLKEKFGFKGGGNQTMIQGGGAKTEIDIEKKVENWIKTL